VTVRAARCRKPTSIAGKHGRSQRRCARTPHPRRIASETPYTGPVPTAPLEFRPPRQQLRIALRGQIRPHSDVLPYRRGQCTQYGWAAMGLRHLSWMISTVHDESRTPAASTLRSTNFALYSGQIRTSRCYWTPGAAPRGWRIWRRRSRHPRSSRPTRNSTKLGKIRYDTCCAVLASRIVRKGRAPPAAGGCEAQPLPQPLDRN
jgi:hypothetical protein